MNVIEAMQALKDGKKIRGRKWKNKQIYFELNENGQIVNLHGNLVNIWPNSLTSDDWELYEPEYFDFFEAIARIKEGKRVTCKHNSNFYYYYDEDLNKPLRMIKASNLNNSQAVFCDFETNSKEWYEVE